MEGNLAESIHQQFVNVEAMCLGFEDFIDANEKTYLLALEKLRTLVKHI